MKAGAMPTPVFARAGEGAAARGDWLEDAVAFAVTGDRYTAGVANLRARATIWGRG